MSRVVRLTCLSLALLIALGGAAPAVAAPIGVAPAAEGQGSLGIVLAQVEPPPRRRQGGLFRFLFKNRRERQQVVPRREFRLIPRERAGVPVLREQPRRQSRQRRQEEGGEERPRKERKQRKNRPAAAAPAEVKAVEKAPDAKRVLVMGDFMAGALAKGLTEAFAQEANVVVVDGSKGDSGLVRADYYNWAVEIPAVMESQKPDALLMLIGANDRQSIGTDAGSQALGSDGWRLAYASRVSALADALRATTKPVLWVGLPPVKSSAMSRDYSAQNGIVREQLESRGMRYVDVWNGFADENGKFVGTGPDVSGQAVQLRAGDGVNFTKAGQRKLAFFVERELTELLGTAQPLLASASPATPSNIEPAGQAPRIGPMIPLEAVPVAGDALSAGAAPADPQQGAIAGAISSRLSAGPVAGVPPGRADDFSWPAPPPPVPPPAPSASSAAAPIPPILPAGAAQPAPQATAAPP